MTSSIQSSHPQPNSLRKQTVHSGSGQDGYRKGELGYLGFQRKAVVLSQLEKHEDRNSTFQEARPSETGEEPRELVEAPQRVGGQ